MSDSDSQPPTTPKASAVTVIGVLIIALVSIAAIGTLIYVLFDVVGVVILGFVFAYIVFESAGTWLLGCIFGASWKSIERGAKTLNKQGLNPEIPSRIITKLQNAILLVALVLLTWLTAHLLASR